MAAIVRWMVGLFVAGLAAPAMALSSIVFFDGGTPFTGAATGTGGATFDLDFSVDGVTFDVDDVAIEIVFLAFDHNFLIDVNSGDPGNLEEVPIDDNDPVAFTPTVDQPWIPNANGLPRLIVTLTQSGVTFRATTSTTSSTLVDVTYPLAINAPVFQDGANTIRIQNPDGAGPDGMDFRISGTVPEPSAASLLSLGLAGLAWRRRH